MFSSNTFGALAMDESSPSASGSQVREGEETDVDWLKLVKPNHEVYVRVQDKVDIGSLPSECSLLAIANSQGLLIVGGNSDVRIHKLSDVHATLEGTTTKDAIPTCTPVQTISLPARPVWIRLAAGEERLVVATMGAGVLFYKLADVLAGNTQPYGSITSGIPDTLIDVVPNPAAPGPDPLWRYVILLAREGLVIVDIQELRPSAPLAGPFTAASWSSKGKQMVVGTQEGKLVQYTPEGVAKAEIPSPPELENYYPSFIAWLENDLFLTAYAGRDADPSESLELFVIHRNKPNFTFTKFFDVNDSMGYTGRAAAQRHFASLKDWGDSKHLAFLVSPIASEIGVLQGKHAEGKNAPDWAALFLEETARAVLPAAKAGVRDDTSPLGLALDLTSTKPIVRGIVGGEELPDLPPAPRLIVYSQEGFIITFDVRNPDAGGYPGMAAASSAAGATSAPVPAAAPAAPAFGGFGQTSLGQSAFGSTTPAKPAAAFGSFDSNAISSNGASDATPAKPPAFGASAFGSTTPSSTPAFGSTTPASTAFGSTTPSKTPAFGATAFGGSAASTAFGSTPSKPAFGSSSFGSTTPGASPAKASAFGSSPAPAFGQTTTPAPAFGQSSTPSAAFGQSSTPGSAFGQSSSPSAFGKPAFGTSSGSAFGTKPTTSAFGQSAFGASSPGTSAFGASSGSAFGQSAFGSKPGTSAFASASDSAFGKPAASFTFNQNAEEKKPSPTFGGGSAFTNPAFGKTFGGQTNPFAIKEEKPSDDSFGLGSLGSAISSDKASAPGTVESPPDSPVLGSGRVPGLDDDDDSPPSTPAPKPAATMPTSSTSSFIKPATAFGSMASSSGAFSNPTAPKSGSAPSAFATPGDKSTAPAFGEASKPAFGQTTALGQNAGKPAFGQATAFGQTAGKPAFGQSTAFGQGASTATPAAAPIGNISGGFGGFAAKSTEKSTTGGFGAFAAKDAPSVFGGDKDKSFLGNAPKPISFGDKPQEAKAASSSKEDIKPAPATETKPATSEDTPKGYDVPAPKSPEPKAADNEGNQPQGDKADDTSDSGANALEPKLQSTPEKSASPEPVVETPPSEAEGEGYETDEDLEEYDEDGSNDEGEYDDDDYDEEYDEDEDGHPRSPHSISQPPDMDTIPEGDEDSGSGSDEEGGAKKPLRSPTWFADSSSSGSSLLSRLGPPVDNSKDTSTENSTSPTSSPEKKPSLLSRMSPPPSSSPPSSRPVSQFTLKHAPKTSSPLSNPATTAEPGTPSATPPDSPGPESSSPQSRSSVGGVGPDPASSTKSDQNKKDDAPKDAEELKDKPAFAFGDTAVKSGEWMCDTCLLKNTDSAKDQCSVCESPRPGATPAQKPKIAAPPAPPSGGFSFGGKPISAGPPTSPTSAQVGPAPPAAPFSFGKTVSPAPASGKKPAAQRGEWTCDTCMLQNSESDQDQCAVCEAPRRPGAAPVEKPKIAGPPAPPSGGFSFGGKPLAPFAGPTFGGKPSSSGMSMPPVNAFTGKPAAPTTAQTSDQKTSSSGEWTCDTCMCKSPESAKDCIVCEAPRPGATPAEKPKIAGPPVPPTGGFSFGKPAAPVATSAAVPPAAPSGGFSFGKPATTPSTTTVTAPVPPAGGFSFGKSATPAASGNPSSKSADAATSTSAPGSLFGQPTTPAPTTPVPFSFTNKAPAPAATSRAPAPGSLFNTPAPAAAPAPGSLFGTPSTSAPAPSSLFGTAPAPASPAPGSLFGKTSSATAPSAPGPLFGNTGATPAKPVGSLFGGTSAPPVSGLTAAPPALGAAAPADASKPSTLGQGSTPALGLGRPPAPSTSSAHGTSPSTPTTHATPSTPTAAIFNVPKRSAVPVQPPKQPSTAKGMGATLERVFGDVQDDLRNLKLTLEANKSHHDALAKPDFPAPTAANIRQHAALPFSSLATVSKIAEELEHELHAVRAEVQQSDIKLAELQSRMLKTDMKARQAEKFLKARQDPSFARAMQIKELSPQQSADQVRLRKVVQMTEARLAEVEAGVNGLKRRTERRDSRHTPQQPALERMQRTVRNIDVAIRDRQQSMDELTRRINSLRIARGGSEVRTRESTPALAPAPTPRRVSTGATQSPKGTHGTPSRARGSSVGLAESQPIPLKPTKEQKEAVAKALDAKPIKLRVSKAVVTKADRRGVNKPSSLVAHASVARGPVMLDAMPQPGCLKLTPGPSKGVSAPSTPVVATTAQKSPAHAAAAPVAPTSPASPVAPAPAPATPSFGFAGIKLDLDPGNIASTPGSRRGGATGNRTHHSAVKLSNVPTKPATSGGTLFGAVVSPPKTEEKKDPSGFSSFSGFGK